MGIRKLAQPQFFLLFDIGLGKPLSKASSGQASDGLPHLPSNTQRLLTLMETNLPDPKAVLANEAFPKGSPRPDFFCSQTQADWW
jgi:hypothetical protein